DKGGLDSGIYGKAAVVKEHGFINDHRLAEKHGLRLDEDCRYIGGEKIGEPAEDPILRFAADIDDDLFGRQRRPADVFAATTPIDPGRSPFAAGNPRPARIMEPHPAAIVKDDPPPGSFGLIGNPVPPIVVRIDPTTHSVRAPVGSDIVRNPDLAPARNALKRPIGFECGAKFKRN